MGWLSVAVLNGLVLSKKTLRSFINSNGKRGLSRLLLLIVR